MPQQDEALPPQLSDRISGLDKELEAIAWEFPQSLEAEPTPELIYHYTDDNGFRGILDSGSLWCTDVAYLNDPSEIKYGVSLATELLAAEVAGASLAEQLFARDFRHYERQAQEAAHSFVCSFSIKDNDLEQWRAYANNGRGYALGFDGRSLETLFTRTDGQPILEHMTFRVSYDETKLKDICRQLIRAVLPLVTAPADMGLSNETVEAYMRDLRISLALYVFRTALFFKHPAYCNEREYRFMQIHRLDRPPPVEFRSRPNMLLRYRKIDWKATTPDSLKDIVIGPGLDPRTGGRFVDDCLRAYLPMGTPHVRLSGIPYRPS
jgi:hypothetical protein